MYYISIMNGILIYGMHELYTYRFSYVHVVCVHVCVCVCVCECTCGGCVCVRLHEYMYNSSLHMYLRTLHQGATCLNQVIHNNNIRS